MVLSRLRLPIFFFFNDTAPPEISTLSLHDALPICHLDDHHTSPGRGRLARAGPRHHAGAPVPRRRQPRQPEQRRRRLRAADRKSTRLNSSHSQISYAVFCLKKKKKKSSSANCLIVT